MVHCRSSLVTMKMKSIYERPNYGNIKWQKTSKFQIIRGKFQETLRILLCFLTWLIQSKVLINQS